ncbi:MAG: alpha-L-fucosidase [Cellulosilyticaceae bacterium]
MNTQQYLEEIEKVIEEGQYKDNWASLSNHPIPKWYQAAKFGIFIHWGVYSVPAFGNEWYPRNAYRVGSKEYQYHIEKYGGHKAFGYKDFIPLFKAEKFDAKKWIALFKQSGAGYVMPVAEHHDGFQMYGSELSPWNAVEMGPKRDILGEIKEEAEKEGIVFCASSHRAEHYWFLNGGREFDSDVNDSKYETFYGPAAPGGEETHDIYAMPPTKEYLEDWLARTCEIVDKYKPKIMWFDWWIHNIAFKPYLKKFAAYYYNRALEWEEEVTINYKYEAFAPTVAVYDIERGQLNKINPKLWQNDTAIAKNSWGYTENNSFKAPKDIICDLIDVVSKNGCLLLNIGPKADGTFTKEETDILIAIGEWMKVNGEGIYDTTFWHVFGEGPTEVPEGAFTDTQRAHFTSEDIRFTYKEGTVYAFVLEVPIDGKVTIKSMKKTSSIGGGDFDIKEISILGNQEKVGYSRDEEGLHIQFKMPIPMEYPIGIKIQID